MGSFPAHSWWGQSAVFGWIYGIRPRGGNGSEALAQALDKACRGILPGEGGRGGKEVNGVSILEEAAVGLLQDVIGQSIAVKFGEFFVEILLGLVVEIVKNGLRQPLGTHDGAVGEDVVLSRLLGVKEVAAQEGAVGLDRLLGIPGEAAVAETQHRQGIRLGKELLPLPHAPGTGGGAHLPVGEEDHAEHQHAQHNDQREELLPVPPTDGEGPQQQEPACRHQDREGQVEQHIVPAADQQRCRCQQDQKQSAGVDKIAPADPGILGGAILPTQEDGVHRMVAHQERGQQPHRQVEVGEQHRVDHGLFGGEEPGQGQQRQHPQHGGQTAGAADQGTEDLLRFRHRMGGGFLRRAEDLAAVGGTHAEPALLHPLPQAALGIAAKIGEPGGGVGIHGIAQILLLPGAEACQDAPAPAQLPALICLLLEILLHGAVILRTEGEKTDIRLLHLRCSFPDPRRKAAG